MQESWEGYGKNWMHFVYKTDNLFQSIGISFFKPYLNSWLFVCSKCTIQSHIIIFQSFLTSFVIFHALLLILSYKTLKLKSISNELWKGWKLAWYHHFIHIACAKKLRGLRQKLDALRVQNGQWYHTRLLQSWHGIIIIVAGESLHFFFACVICLLRRNHG